MDSLREFGSGFMKAARETPRLYFSPLLIAWKCCRGQSLTADEKVTSIISILVLAALLIYLMVSH